MPDPGLLISRPIFRGRVVDLSVDDVRLPNGNVCALETIRHPGASAVVPVDREGRVLLVRQYRWATGGYILEVPAGKLDAGEAPEACARREVEEETGHRARDLTPLGWVWTTPGFSDEKIWLYLATDVEPARQDLQPDEVLTIEAIPFDDAVAMAGNGTIVDAKSICALLRAARQLKR
jgi:ADP-ribose pyrophosphatase